MLNQVLFFIYSVLIIIFSAIVHEVSHGFSAKLQGDDTAEAAGRLTLNPWPHLDAFGSVILPFLLALPALFGAPVVVIGWAKPVPYNPNNLKNKRWGPALVALAGPLSNIFLALIFGAVLRVTHFFPSLPPALDSFLVVIIWTNLLLAIFNLVPLPPLDGSKIVFSVFPLMGPTGRKFREWLEQYGFALVLLFIFFGVNLILPAVYALFSLIAG